MTPPTAPIGLCRAAHPASATLAQMLEVILPDQAHHYGTRFAGHALNLLSEAAFVAARRHARGAARW